MKDKKDKMDIVNKSEIIEEREKRRRTITEMVEDFMYAKIPPSLDHIKNMAREMGIYDCEDKWNCMGFAMIMCVGLKGMQTGDPRVLELFLKLAMIMQGDPKATSQDKNFKRLVDAIRELNG